MLDHGSGVPDRGKRVAHLRLGHDVLARQVGGLLADRSDVVTACDHTQVLDAESTIQQGDDVLKE